MEQWVQGPGLRVAEIDRKPVGASVVVDASPHPEHIAPADVPETYLMFLIGDRNHAGEGIGSALVQRAIDEARAAGSELLRVDCWAGAPGLIEWYERQGFVPSATYTVDVRGGWTGQVFEMAL